MNYGVFSKEVEEVVQFVKTGQLFKPSNKLPEGVAAIYSFEDAMDSAWNKTYGKAEYLWTDIREQEMRPIEKTLYEIPDRDVISDNLTACIETFYQHIRRQLPNDMMKILDDVLADLDNCAQARAAFGTASKFFETQFKIYRAGGWPCGWQGDYPEGKMLAYLPPAP
jgi:hypothetical protein